MSACMVVFTVHAYEGFHLFVRIGGLFWFWVVVLGFSAFGFLVCVWGGGVFCLHICLCILFMQYPQRPERVSSP